MFTDPRLALYARGILVGGVALIAVLLFFCILRTVKGPRIADRILSINRRQEMEAREERAVEEGLHNDGDD